MNREFIDLAYDSNDNKTAKMMQMSVILVQMPVVLVTAYVPHTVFSAIHLTLRFPTT